MESHQIQQSSSQIPPPQSGPTATQQHVAVEGQPPAHPPACPSEQDSKQHSSASADSQVPAKVGAQADVQADPRVHSQAESQIHVHENIQLNPQLAAFLAWIVPGLGHFLLGRALKALAFFGAVAALLFLGLSMRGLVFPPRPSDPFAALGFLADLGSGSFYFLSFLSRFMQSAATHGSLAIADYGTRMIASAGMVNILAAIDAYEIASGRRR